MDMMKSLSNKQKKIGLLLIVLLVMVIGISIALSQLSSSEIISVNAQEAMKLIETNPKLLIVDVRELSEFQAGHIAGSVSIPLGVLDENLDKLKVNEPILLVCKTGFRSMRAANLLLDNEFKKIYNLTNGISQWPGELQK